jgi:DNA-binding NarL/FixJ family response regulator
MKQGRILIVEDDPFVQMTLAQALESANFEIVARVATPTDAISAAKSGSVDVAILDLDLGPGASGIDVAHALRQNNARIGLILLTSYTDPRISDPNARALPKGTIFLTKSITTETTMRIPVPPIATALMPVIAPMTIGNTATAPKKRAPTIVSLKRI